MPRRNSDSRLRCILYRVKPASRRVMADQILVPKLTTDERSQRPGKVLRPHRVFVLITIRDWTLVCLRPLANQ